MDTIIPPRAREMHVTVLWLALVLHLIVGKRGVRFSNQSFLEGRKGQWNPRMLSWEISLSTIKLLCLILVDAISCWINSALSWFLCSWTIKILPIFSNIMEFWKRSPLKWTNNHSDVKDNARPLSYTILNLQLLIFIRQFLGRPFCLYLVTQRKREATERLS